MAIAPQAPAAPRRSFTDASGATLVSVAPGDHYVTDKSSEIVVTLLGWAYSSAAGFPVVWFGLLQLPDFVPVDKLLAEAIKPWHERSAMLMAALVVLHIAGAVKHQFIDRDGLIDRMRPARG
jgi:hypothetical protein